MKVLTALKVIFGFITLVLAAIGLLLPIWPTTPFVLLSVWLFGSTPKLKNKILKIPFIKEYYFCYKEKKPVKKKTVMISLVFLWAMLGVSAWLTGNLLVLIILAAVGISVTVHILWITGKKRTGKVQTV